MAGHQHRSSSLTSQQSVLTPQQQQQHCPSGAVLTSCVLRALQLVAKLLQEEDGAAFPPDGLVTSRLIAW
jgi:hypothetical protein